jgi:hypothetical protein
MESEKFAYSVQTNKDRNKIPKALRKKYKKVAKRKEVDHQELVPMRGRGDTGKRFFGND